MLFHQLREHFILGLKLFLQMLYPFGFWIFDSFLWFVKGGCAIFKELLLPAVEHRWLQMVLITKIRYRDLVNKVPFE